MSRKAVIWEDGRPGYNQIFGQSAETLLYSYSLYKFCDQRRRELVKQRKQIAKGKIGKSKAVPNNINESITRYGIFHIARIMSHYLVGELSHNEDLLLTTIEELNSVSPKVEKAYRDARKLLREVLLARKKQRGMEFVSYFNELRSSEIDRAIDKHLFSKTKALAASAN